MQISIVLVTVLLRAVTAVPVAQTWSAWSTYSAAPSQSTPSQPTPSSPAPGSSAPLKSGNPFSFPLPNGFDGLLSGQALLDTEVQAQGKPPGGAMLSEDDLTSFRLIAFNEIWETAFFTDLLYNITNNVPGYEAPALTTAAITAIQAQEELHALAANSILQANNKNIIQPCQYKFPTTTLAGALAFAQTFTDLVVGTLQDVQYHLATNGAAAVVPIIGSVIGQESEQTGYYRSSAGLIPSAQPFLTRASREFAFSALNQMVIVPGSCPNVNEIDLPVFAPLMITTPPTEPQDQTLTFEVGGYNVPSLQGLSLVYISGQSPPIVESITPTSANTFTASFPYTENLLNGLTIAALTTGAGPFMTAEDVAKVTVAGPGLIELK